jgi:shikimate kinase
LGRENYLGGRLAIACFNPIGILFGKRTGGLKLNFILIGTPNSGKTTLGKKAASALGMRFYDIDVEVANHIAAVQSDPSFSNFLREFLGVQELIVRRIARKAENAIISTGAETTLSQKNVQALRRCGRFILIKREPDRMSRETRKKRAANPAKSGGWNATEAGARLYKDLMPEYEKLADFTLENNGDEDSGLKGLVTIIQSQS